MMENMGCLFFHILSKHCISGYYGQLSIGKYSSFVTASLHVKVLSCIVRETHPQKEERTGHWLAFSLYTKICTFSQKYLINNVQCSIC